MTQWVLEKAIKNCAEWQRFGLNINISVNLSTIDILNVELPDIITGLLAAYDFEPQWLTLELTESAIMTDQKVCLEILKRLSKLGIEISIDDFGTGYSSLAYLSKLPVDEVKIDKSFVMSMDDRPEDALIVRSVIDLAHNLGLTAVAEGVCNKSIYQRLSKLGCNTGQGFFISKPMPHDTLLEWLKIDWQKNASYDEIEEKRQGLIHPNNDADLYGNA